MMETQQQASVKRESHAALASDESQRRDSPLPRLRPRVVIVGGGFGGLWCARGLAREAVDVVLIDRTNHHLFQPLLYQVATAGLSSPDIAAPLRHILRRQRNAEVLLGHVASVDVDKKTVTLSTTEEKDENHEGAAIHYDFLVVASGATHSYFGRDQWQGVAPGLKTLQDALEIRRRILLAFEHAEAAPRIADASLVPRQGHADVNPWLNFVVIGGGPTGVELAGTLAEIARHTLRKEFRNVDPSQARVYLIEGGPRVLASFPESLSVKAKQQLERLGVIVKCGAPASEIDADGVTVGAERIEAKTVLWAAGVAASPLGRALANALHVELDRVGRVKLGATLSLSDADPRGENVFVVGDLASVSENGRAVPGVAPAAKQMGAYVAKAIAAKLRGTAVAPFRYRDYGNLATIGRLAAVVDLRGLRLSGAFAWMFWLLAHVFFLIGFRNRAVVMLNWAWSYWTYQRSARIILNVDAIKRQ